MRLLFLLLILLITNAARSQWQVDGNVICDTSDNNPVFKLPKIAPDGEGGAYVCWRDLRNGTDYDIYAQRIDSGGKALWQRNGVPIVQAPQNQDFPRIADDGLGGAFIAWEDDRSLSNTFVYVQRVTRKGESLWQPNGVKASETGGLFISLASDEDHGALLAWSTVEDVVVQRLDSLGNRVWSDSGIRVTSRSGAVSPGDVSVVSDGALGCIVSWAEGDYPHYRVYAQRVDSSGQPRWQTNGILLSDSMKDAFDVVSTFDSKGGAIVKWFYGGGTGGVQRVSGLGQKRWQVLGVPLSVSGSGGNQRISSDDRGGAFIGHGTQIYHVDSTGAKLWGPDGAPYITTSGSTNSSQVHNGHQGVFNFTEFYSDSLGWFILGQFIDSAGIPRFGPDGKKVTSTILTNGRQFWPSATADDRGGALVCWNDNRDGNSPIYIARIDTQGVVTGIGNDKGEHLPDSPVLEQNYPNPFNSGTSFIFSLPSGDYVSVKVYDLLGQDIATVLTGYFTAGAHHVQFNPSFLASGIYFYRLTTQRTTIVRKMIFAK
jgi:hypothetical protein